MLGEIGGNVLVASGVIVAMALTGLVALACFCRFEQRRAGLPDDAAAGVPYGMPAPVRPEPDPRPERPRKRRSGLELSARVSEIPLGEWSG